MDRTIRQARAMALSLAAAALFVVGCATAPVPTPAATSTPRPSATPAQSAPPPATPTPVPTGSPTSTPAPSTSTVTFKPGAAPFAGTRWVLVAYSSDGQPHYVSPSADAVAELRLSLEGELAGSTGCLAFGGGYRPDGKLIKITITSDASTCAGPLGVQHNQILSLFQRVAAQDVLLDPKANMAPGLQDAQLQPSVLAHFAAHPDVMHLILRDQSGEAVLVFGAAEG
jgi:heat shock protein HslJ